MYDKDTPDKIRKHVLNYNHVKGRCLIHSGKQRHGALPITSGKRCNLIVWCKSSLKREIVGGRDRMIKSYKHTGNDDDGKDNSNNENENIPIPDIVCLSRTHDSDYNYWMKKLDKVEQDNNSKKKMNYSSDDSTKRERIVNDTDKQNDKLKDNPLLS